MAAGIQARQLGLEDVLVIEKQSATGGSFIGTEGLFAVGSHLAD
jgi:fumarate reductase flavoprotein subunit